MKTYSIHWQMWCAVYIPFIYIAAPSFVSIAAIFIFKLSNGINQWNAGNTEDEQEQLAALTQEFILENTMLLLLFSAAVKFIIYFSIWNKERKYLEKNYSIISPFYLFLLCGIGICTNFTISGFLDITKLTEQFFSHQKVEEVLRTGDLLLRVIVFGILGPIVEEIGFRGILYNRLRKSMNVLPAVLVSAVLFGFVHLNILQGLYTGIFGVLLALLYEKTKTIWVPITVHISFNMLSVILAGLLPIDDNRTIITFSMSIVLLPVFIKLILNRYSKI